MLYFDTHVHIGLIHDDPIEQLIVVQEAKQKKVKKFLNICNNVTDFIGVYENLKSIPGVYFAVGTSPTELGHPGKDWQEKLCEYLEYDRVIALGETGLDYDKRFGNQDSQIKLFMFQLDIAQQYGKPVVIHNRKAGRDIVDILSDKMPDRGAIFHCYSENLALAEKIMRQHDNVLFSFAGTVTYKAAVEMQKIASTLPLDKIVVESESPFMSPGTHKNKRNKPAYILDTAQFVASLRPEDDEEVLDALYQNAVRFFDLKD